MAKIVILCGMLFVVVAGRDELTKVACTGDNERERDHSIEQSKCGDPKEVFEYLKVKAAHEQYSPRAVWIKRCVGLCEYDNDGICSPAKSSVRHIPIKIINVKTNKETCATYPIEEHLSCVCRSLGPLEVIPVQPEYDDDEL